MGITVAPKSEWASLVPQHVFCFLPGANLDSSRCRIANKNSCVFLHKKDVGSVCACVCVCTSVCSIIYIYIYSHNSKLVFLLPQCFRHSFLYYCCRQTKRISKSTVLLEFFFIARGVICGCLCLCTLTSQVKRSIYLLYSLTKMPLHSLFPGVKVKDADFFFFLANVLQWDEKVPLGKRNTYPWGK